MQAKRLTASERKKQIATAAAALFARRGFTGVTTREIAKKARVNEAIIFRYFPTKEALYTEIINQSVHIKPGAFNLKAAEEGNDEEVFRSVLRYLLRQAKKDNVFLRLMLFSALEGHTLSNLFLKSRVNILFDFLHAYITKQINSGSFRPVDVKATIRALTGMIFHFIIVRELFRAPKNLRISEEDAVRNFVDIFLNGIQKK